MNQNSTNTFSDLTDVNTTSTSIENNGSEKLPIPRFVFGIVAGLWVFMLCAPIIAPTIENWRMNRNKKKSQEEDVELNNTS